MCSIVDSEFVSHDVFIFTVIVVLLNLVFSGREKTLFGIELAR
jgi:hypothetical protein